MKQRITYFVFGVVVASVVFFTYQEFQPPVDPLPPEIIEKMVTVVEVKEIEGPETIVEVVRWKTKRVPVPQHIIARMVEDLCAERTPSHPPPMEITPSEPPSGLEVRELPTLEGRIAVEASKHIGRDGDRIVAGWVGRATCYLGLEGENLNTLVTEEIDQTISMSVSEIATVDLVKKGRPALFEMALGIESDPALRGEARWFARNNRWGLYLGGEYKLDPEELSFSSGDQYSSSSGSFTEDTWTVGAGVAWRFGS